MFSLSNTTPGSSCTYSSPWDEHKDVVRNSWIVREADDFYVSHVTAPVEADVEQNNNGTKDELKEVSRPLREKNARKNVGYKHVPHKDKPPQVVAKRNARERRRVQAVNGAFVKLRKAVPIENTRGKRVSKVKTLQNAIQYIQRLQRLLQQDKGYCPVNDVRDFHDTSTNNADLFDDFYFED